MPLETQTYNMHNNYNVICQELRENFNFINKTKRA